MRKTAPLSDFLNDDEVQELKHIEKFISHFNDEFNLFNYLENLFNENVWSRIFAFLLDTEQKHQLGSKIFNFWISIIASENADLVEPFLSKTGDIHKVIATTEWTTPGNRRVDLLLELMDEKGLAGVIGIENKLESNEQREQLSDYQKSISEIFPDVPKLFFYITPEGRESQTALKSFPQCPYIPISYSSIREICFQFTKDSDGEVALVLKSLNNYLKYLLYKSRKKELHSQSNIVSLPFNERNKYSPVLPFFEKLEEHFKANQKFPFNRWAFKTFSTTDIDFFDWDLYAKGLLPCYMLNSLKREPRPGDYFVVRLMIHSQALYKTMGSRDKKIKAERLEYINKTLTYFDIKNNRNKLRHWHPWINIWTSEKYELIDLGEKDIKNLLDLLHRVMFETYYQFKKNFQVLLEDKTFTEVWNYKE